MCAYVERVESRACRLNQSVTRIPLWWYSGSWRFEQREKEKLESSGRGRSCHPLGLGLFNRSLFLAVYKEKKKKCQPPHFSVWGRDAAAYFWFSCENAERCAGEETSGRQGPTPATAVTSQLSQRSHMESWDAGGKDRLFIRCYKRPSANANKQKTNFMSETETRLCPELTFLWERRGAHSPSVS